MGWNRSPLEEALGPPLLIVQLRKMRSEKWCDQGQVPDRWRKEDFEPGSLS